MKLNQISKTQRAKDVEKAYRIINKEMILLEKLQLNQEGEK